MALQNTYRFDFIDQRQTAALADVELQFVELGRDTFDQLTVQFAGCINRQSQQQQNYFGMCKLLVVISLGKTKSVCEKATILHIKISKDFEK